jgi:hypothetical protein
MNLKQRLSSRKLWVAIGTFIVFVANNQWTEAMGVVIAYLGLQGVQDTVGQRYGGSPEISQDVLEDEIEVDTSVVETGKGIPLFNEEIKEED